MFWSDHSAGRLATESMQHTLPVLSKQGLLSSSFRMFKCRPYSDSDPVLGRDWDDPFGLPTYRVSRRPNLINKTILTLRRSREIEKFLTKINKVVEI